MTYTMLEKKINERLTFRVGYDDSSVSPREDTTLLTQIVAFSRKYRLSDTDEFGSEEEFLDSVRESDIVMPLYMLDHGAQVAIYTDADLPGNSIPSRVGHVLVTPEAIERVGLRPDNTEIIKGLIRSEIDEYSKYLNGEVFTVGAHHVCRGQALPKAEVCVGGIVGWDETAFDEAAMSLLLDLSEEDSAGVTNETIESADWDY